MHDGGERSGNVQALLADVRGADRAATVAGRRRVCGDREMQSTIDRRRAHLSAVVCVTTSDGDAQVTHSRTLKSKGQRIA